MADREKAQQPHSLGGKRQAKEKTKGKKLKSISLLKGTLGIITSFCCFNTDYSLGSNNSST